MYEEKMRFELSVNKKKRVVYVHPSLTLLETLRDELNLTGTKRGCDDSNCVRYPYSYCTRRKSIP